MRRDLGDGYELDDDRSRVDVDAVHAYLEEHRGRGLGLELVREMVENGPYADRKWILHTRDMHRLYEKVGFGEPGERLMERTPVSDTNPGV